MITQIVLYDVNPRNPLAAELIVSKAEEILGRIPNTSLVIGPAIDSARAVACSNGKVVKMTTWPDETAKQEYFAHPLLSEWCRFVLRGWMLKGDTSSDPEAKFMDHILSGKKKRRWARNPEIPEEEVVWNGEEIVLFSHE